MAEAGPSTFVKPRQVVYCGVCTYPPEYCTYGSKLSKCKKWLAGSHPDLFTKYYGDENPSEVAAAGPSTTTSSSKSKSKSKKGDAAPADEDDNNDDTDLAVKKTSDKLSGMTLEEEAAKKEAKAERKAAKAEAQRMSSKILIKRQERTKRKMTTSIQGLEVFGIELKKASKLFANKFATGASVSKNNQGDDEIVIQGDVAYEVEEMLLKKTGKEGDVFGGKVPEDNIEIIDVKRKKATEE